jgi:glutamate 5-kinase
MPMRNKDLVFVGAVTSGVGTLTKAMGSTTIKAVGIAASVGFVAVLSTWYKNQ